MTFHPVNRVDCLSVSHVSSTQGLDVGEKPDSMVLRFLASNQSAAGLKQPLALVRGPVCHWVSASVPKVGSGRAAAVGEASPLPHWTVLTLLVLPDLSCGSGWARGGSGWGSFAPRAAWAGPAPRLHFLPRPLSPTSGSPFNSPHLALPLWVRPLARRVWAEGPFWRSPEGCVLTSDRRRPASLLGLLPSRLCGCCRPGLLCYSHGLVCVRYHGASLA